MSKTLELQVFKFQNRSRTVSVLRLVLSISTHISGIIVCKYHLYKAAFQLTAEKGGTGRDFIFRDYIIDPIDFRTAFIAWQKSDST